MLKIVNNRIEKGMHFQIRNSWREKIAKMLEIDVEHYPFTFQVGDLREDGYYCCKSVCNDDSDLDCKILVTNIILKYLIGIEVEDSNVGVYFQDYLPLEGTSILLFDTLGDKVDPYKFVFITNKVNKKVVSLDLVLKPLLFESMEQFKDLNVSFLNYYISWKFLHGTDMYMTEKEKMYQDTFIHKEFVEKTCNILADYLESQGLNGDAIALRERAKVHDNSKILNKDEFRALTSIINDKSCLKDASSKLSTYKQDAIELHWKHNTHHPEHFENIENMSRLDRLEMVCDWVARSLQYKTDVLEFVTKRQEDRFHFPELMYDELLCNCKIILNLINKT